MIHQILSSARTGSHYLYKYVCWKYEIKNPYYEIFLPHMHIQNDNCVFDIDAHTEENHIDIKLKFLKEREKAPLIINNIAIICGRWPYYNGFKKTNNICR